MASGQETRPTPSNGDRRFSRLSKVDSAGLSGYMAGIDPERSHKRTTCGYSFTHVWSPMMGDAFSSDKII